MLDSGGAKSPRRPTTWNRWHEIAEPAPLRRQRMVFARFSLPKKLLDRDGHAHAWLVRIESTCYGVQRRQTAWQP